MKRRGFLKLLTGCAAGIAVSPLIAVMPPRFACEVAPALTPLADAGPVAVFEPCLLKCKKLYVRVFVPDELLADSAFPVDSIFRGMLGEQFDFEGIA